MVGLTPGADAERPWCWLVQGGVVKQRRGRRQRRTNGWTRGGWRLAAQRGKAQSTTWFSPMTTRRSIAILVVLLQDHA